MNEMQIFKNREFGTIRTISNEQGEALFCAKDVCDALGYKQTHKAVERHVDSLLFFRHCDGRRCKKHQYQQ